MALDFKIVPKGPFSLELAAQFGFGPRFGDADDGVMRLAFAVDGLHEQAGVVVRQDPDGTVQGEVHGVAAEVVPAVRGQVARILSLDHDGEAWLQVGERDPVIGRLQALHPGFRPVLFHSPYEAAGWAVISGATGQTRSGRGARSHRRAAGAKLQAGRSGASRLPAP